MTDASSSPWRLLREIGLDYVKAPAAKESVSLLGPVSAERTKGRGYLIVDEAPAAGGPSRPQCRTLLLDADLGITYDSRADDIDDAYGCLMERGSFAILRRTRSELCVLSHTGEPVRSVDLSRISKHPPRLLSWTPRKTFLIAFFPGPGNLDIVELDQYGRVLWSRLKSIVTIGIPSCMQLLSDNSILIADELHHVVWQLGRDGESRIRWGRWHSPSTALGNLHRPRWAHVANDGTLLIADSSNGRILAVDRRGRATELQLKDRALFSPSSVRRLDGGNYLICDAGNRCVFELDRRGRAIPRLGSLKVSTRFLSFPRSVQYLGGNRYMVADTGHDAIVDIDGRRPRERAAETNYGLFWPRAARKTKNQSVLIADGRNLRILELSSRGKEIRQLHQIRYKDLFLTLQDPHDVRLQDNGNLLITDSPHNMVVETDWNGRVAWAIGLDGDIALRDPHSAQQLPDGRVLIADTHSNRVLLVDPKTRTLQAITEIRVGNVHCELKLPRYAEALPDGTLVIADTGNNRVLISDLELSFLQVLKSAPDSPIPHFNFPRWVQPISRDELVISDHGNHRILHLRRQYAS